MANHKSAEKRIRQAERRNLRNRTIRTQMKTVSKKARQAIETGEAQAIQTTLKDAMSNIQKAASKGIIKKKTASRHIGRLSKAAHKQLTAKSTPTA